MQVIDLNYSNDGNAIWDFDGSENDIWDHDGSSYCDEDIITNHDESLSDSSDGTIWDFDGCEIDDHVYSIRDDYDDYICEYNEKY